MVLALMDLPHQQGLFFFVVLTFLRLFIGHLLTLNLHQEEIKCALCNKHLSQKSPWGSRSIVKNRDMPVTGVLPCQHVFHAECLDQSSPKTQSNDPSFPICTKQEGEHFKSHNIIPRLKPLCEDGQSTRPWGCVQSECVQSAVMININRLRRNLSHKGNSSKDLPSKIKNCKSSDKSNLACAL